MRARGGRGSLVGDPHSAERCLLQPVGSSQPRQGMPMLQCGGEHALAADTYCPTGATGATRTLMLTLMLFTVTVYCGYGATYTGGSVLCACAVEGTYVSCDSCAGATLWLEDLTLSLCVVCGRSTPLSDICVCRLSVGLAAGCVGDGRVVCGVLVLALRVRVWVRGLERVRVRGVSFVFC